MINYIVWLSVTAMYIPVFLELYGTKWELLDYTHAYFILPVSLFLTWNKRDQIKNIIHSSKQEGSLFGLAILIFGIVVFIFGWQQMYTLVSTLSLIFVLTGLIIYLYGKAIFRTLWFPILYLLLLVPPPLGILDSITLPLRHAISYATQVVLQFANYPITREGLLLRIGYYDIFMGQPCSGFRSLITLLSLGIVYVYMSKSTIPKKFFLTAFIVPLALFGNLVRVITLCLITFYFGEEAGQGFFHNFSGIVMFIITILGLITVESIFNMKKTVGE